MADPPASHPAGAAARPPWILFVIIFSQFAGTSLWFAGNAVLGDLQQQWGLADDALGYVTSAVQLGFITGTLTFAFFAISDRFSPRKVFFACSLLGALANLGIYLLPDGFGSLLAFRFLTGFFLAGVYPVGMKIASGWYQRDLGNAIGFLAGALVLGTAFPHLLKGMGQTFPWEGVTMSVSGIAVLGGVSMLLLVPDGPHLTKGTKFDPAALAVIFRSRLFRASAFGYFGHMWELYAFWAFVPVVLAAHLAQGAGDALNIPFWAFCVIAAGFFGCAGGGLVSLRTGSAPVAFAQLLSSGVCCAISPLLFFAPTPVFLAFLVFWGIVVVGDSPQFSTLNAQNAPKALVGSALTIANCIGFAISIVSIQLLNELAAIVPPAYLFVPLAIGPVLGLIYLMPLLRPLEAQRS
ncbi:MAG: MFS transporter [Betaproteobacteria bacterium]|nr:MFS transporter [Betaproteobacteria bacterium]